mgnify:CR=1 FL=1
MFAFGEDGAFQYRRSYWVDFCDAKSHDESEINEEIEEEMNQQAIDEEDIQEESVEEELEDTELEEYIDEIFDLIS